MNNIAAQIIFNFFYDGTTSSITVDTKRGAVFYLTPQGCSTHPQFQLMATNILTGSVVIGVTNSSVVKNNAPTSVGTIATINNGAITVQIPQGQGLTEGLLQVQATLLY